MSVGLRSCICKMTGLEELKPQHAVTGFGMPQTKSNMGGGGESEAPETLSYLPLAYETGEAGAGIKPPSSRENPQACWGVVTTAARWQKSSDPDGWGCGPGREGGTEPAFVSLHVPL